MKKDIYYFNPVSVNNSLVIVDTTMLIKKGSSLKPFPKSIDTGTMEQIVCEPGDRTDNILHSCLSSNVALILITNN